MKRLTYLAVTALAFGLSSGASAASFQGGHVGIEVASESYDPVPDRDTVFALAAGWDVQVLQTWVVGAGFRYTLDGVSSTKTSLTPDGSVQTASVSIEDQWAVTGRVGRALGDSLLVFAEGGYEYFDVDQQRTVAAQICAPPSTCLVRQYDFSFEDEMWTIGAGLEWAMTKHVRLRGTYSYGDSNALERNRYSLTAAYRF